ncbi:hypothetical protein [Gluconobacter oxydans]|uniref:hypothetical protein n=1 Tax=Gluconobacter oxydans TaxID=442 RepID=UPI0039EB349F
MGYDLSITRDPIWTGRPAHSLTLEEWFNVIQRDNELCFALSSEPRKYPSCDAEWLAHPKPEEAPHGTFFVWGGGDVICKYPDEHQMIKMVRISRKLNAIVIGDNGERYDLDKTGSWSSMTKAPLLRLRDRSLMALAAIPAKNSQRPWQPPKHRTVSCSTSGILV